MRGLKGNTLLILKGKLLAFFLLGFVTVSNGQNNDPSVHHDSVTIQRELPELFITATRTRKNMDEVPARLHSVSMESIESLPALTADAALQLILGANIDRHEGIFSKNSSITLRGLNGTPRTLVMIDGVPISKTDGGGVNWNRMVNDNIERIEVIKGPVSAIYGGNAMAGAINIITRVPSAKLEGEVKALVGTYNIAGGLFSAGGRMKQQGNSLYYALNGFYRRGDGYIIVPESTRDSMDVPAYMWETGGGIKFGYAYNLSSYTEVEYSYFNDKRGDGTRIFEDEGGYNRYPTNYLRLTTSNNFHNINWVLRYFFQDENYLRQSETMSVKKGNKYTLYQTDSHRKDQGIWTNLDWKPGKGMDIIAGFDLKRGSVVGKDIYLTSSDILTNTGKMDFMAFFADYEWKTLKERLTVSAGLRYDYAEFYGGSFSIEEPSTLTEFMTNYPSEFTDATWKSWSPKIGLRYRINKDLDMYLSWSKGFRPAMLDDMCRNGNVSKGFKLANPQLKPETAYNYETGINWNPVEKMSIEWSLYYLDGRDFHYFVGNGDSISTGGDNLKPVIQRQNVSNVTVKGTELSVDYKAFSHLLLRAGYSYNDSRITAFNTTGRIAKDLSGKFLMEVPANQLFVALFHHNRYFRTSLVYNYKDFMWSDDENTVKTPAYHLMDFKIGSVYRQYSADLTIQDIFDTKFFDSKGNLSPGRFFLLTLSYHFKQ